MIASSSRGPFPACQLPHRASLLAVRRAAGAAGTAARTVKVAVARRVCTAVALPQARTTRPMRLLVPVATIQHSTASAPSDARATKPTTLGGCGHTSQGTPLTSPGAVVCCCRQAGWALRIEESSGGVRDEDVAIDWGRRLRGWKRRQPGRCELTVGACYWMRRRARRPTRVPFARLQCDGYKATVQRQSQRQ